MCQGKTEENNANSKAIEHAKALLDADTDTSCLFVDMAD
jgi:hypothetical protein